MIGFAKNHVTSTSAKTVLVFMVNFVKGSPALVACLAPSTNLNYEFLVEILLLVIKITKDARGFAFGTVANNLPVN